MITKLKHVKGEAEIAFHREGQTPSSHFFHNAVVPNARELIARALGGVKEFLVDTIEVYNQGTLLATESTVPSFPQIGIVKFTAVFPVDSFQGNFDEIRLVCSQNGDFSHVTGISLTKPTDELLSIGWKIKPQ